MSDQQSMLQTYSTFEEFTTDFLNRINKSTYWSDDQVSSLVSLLADVLGDIGVTNSYATMIAAREAFIRLARRRTSVLECARFLGVEIERKSCPRVTARIINPTDQKITAQRNTSFTVNGELALLDQMHVWQPGETKDVVLKLGWVQDFSQLLTTVPEYFKTTIPILEFMATKEMDVWTEDLRGVRTTYTRLDSSLFRATPGQNIYLDMTLNEGQVELQFGSKQFGSVPQDGSMLKARIVCTKGSILNNEISNLVVKSPDLALQGKTISNIAGGADEKELDYYRTFGPTRARTDKLITQSEWRAAVMLYPDVADCRVMNQAEIAPNDRQWQGVIRICVLPKSVSTWGGTNPNPTSAQWQAFLTHMKKYGSPLDIQTWNSTKLQVDVSITVALFKDAIGTLQSNEDVVRQAVLGLTARRLGSLGRRLSRSDIVDAALFDSSDPDNVVRRADIDYCEILSPQQDIIPRSALEHVVIRNLRVNMIYSERNK